MNKISLIFVLVCFVIFACGDTEKITDSEITELIEDYNNLYKNFDGEKTAPVRSH